MNQEILEANALVEYTPSDSVDMIDKEAQSDIEEARQIYKELIVKGQEGLEVAFELVEGSQHPRAIEVFANLLNSVSTINSKIIDLHETKKKMQNKPSADTNSSVTNNNVFLGSPAELLALMNQEK